MIITQIISEINNGDIQAPKRLYVHTYKLLFGVAYQYVSCDNLSKDILQNTYIRIFKNLSQTKFNNDTAAISWLRRICINEALSFIRAKKNWDKLQFTPKKRVATNENGLRRQEIYNLILKLPTQQRMVFNLFAVEGYTHKEIAKLLNISISNSTTLLTRARKFLSKQLTKEVNHESIR